MDKHTSSNALNWRPAKREDLPLMRQLLIANQDADKTESIPSLDEMGRIFDFLGAQLQTFTRMAITPENDVVAVGFIFPSADDEAHVLQVDGNVHIDYRRQGLGTALMQWAEETAVSHWQQYDDKKPRRLLASTLDHRHSRIALFERHGFQPMRYFYTMSCDLQEPLSDKLLPEGITAVPYKPELDLPMMNAFNAAFAQHWGLPTMTIEHWQQRFTDTPHFRSDLTYLALDEQDEVVGFCLTEVHGNKNQQMGIKEAWIEAIGVLPRWRKKGLASALMNMAMKQYKAIGMETVGLDVDTENPTGALRLYENLGFIIKNCKIAFIKSFN